jgi:hypothetical protein
MNQAFTPMMDNKPYLDAEFVEHGYLRDPTEALAAQRPFLIEDTRASTSPSTKHAHTTRQGVLRGA